MPTEELYPCPFCGAKAVKVIRHPAHREYVRSRGSGQSSGQWVYVPEKIEVLSGCSNCGASKAKIQKAVNSGVEDKPRQLDVKALLEKARKKWGEEGQSVGRSRGDNL